MLIIPIGLSSINRKPTVVNPIKKEKPKYYVVKATVYTVDNKQTDSTPNITSTGYILDSINPRKHKIIAVSRDLKKILRYGSKVRVSGTGRLDGVYTVRDLMNKRWKRKIDILINPHDEMRSYNNVKIYPL